MARSVTRRLSCDFFHLINHEPSSSYHVNAPRFYSSATTTHTPYPVFRDIPSLRALRRQQQQKGQTVGFVPTMGALHDGHLSLVRTALAENDQVFVSIYVNPTQFGVHEDLDKYPKTFDSDMDKLHHLEQHLTEKGQYGRICGIFAPTTKVMYPTSPPNSEIDGEGSFVTITPLGKWLEGASRPVFFRGVATVCTKLFNIVQPDRVYFGQKDIQQSVLIRRMVRDFHIPIQVRVIDTEREPDGLAMSSRNVFLGRRRRDDVRVFPSALMRARHAWSDVGQRSVAQLKKQVRDTFATTLEVRDGAYYGKSCKMEIDYIAVSRIEDMSELNDDVVIGDEEGAILSAAVRVYPVFAPENEQEREQIMVRLIDNVILQPTDQQ